MVFVQRDLFFIAPDTVGFPDDQCIKHMFRRICQHALKLFTVIISSCLRTINIFMNDCQTMLQRITFCLGELSFNGLLALLMAGITGINNGIHQNFTSFAGSKSNAMRAMARSLFDARS